MYSSPDEPCYECNRDHIDAEYYEPDEQCSQTIDGTTHCISEEFHFTPFTEQTELNNEKFHFANPNILGYIG